jgi:hypothetical protein
MTGHSHSHGHKNRCFIAPVTVTVSVTVELHMPFGLVTDKNTSFGRIRCGKLYARTGVALCGLPVASARRAPQAVPWCGYRSRVPLFRPVPKLSQEGALLGQSGEKAP